MAPIRALACVIALAGCVSEGSVSLEIGWKDERPDKDRPLFILAKVERRTDPFVRGGEVLATAGPARFPPGIELSLRVPNGDERVVIVEVREVPDLHSPIVYYGLSETFSVQAGESSAASVFLELTATPGKGPDTEASGRVVLHRSPWGRDGAATPQTVLEGGPGAAQPRAVLIATDASSTREIGRAKAGSDGAFRIELGAADRVLVNVAEVDGVGKASHAPLVREGRWTASLGRPADHSGMYPTPSANPHRVVVTSMTRPSVAQDSLVSREITRGEADSLSGLDVTDAIYVFGAGGRWREAARSGVYPQLHELVGWAHDSARGRSVLVGRGVGGALETWEWDGVSWHDATISRADFPEGFSPGGVAYQALIGEVAMFGVDRIDGSTVSLRLWTWSGTRWRQQHLHRDLANLGAENVVYDAERGAVTAIMPVGDSLGVVSWSPDTTYYGGGVNSPASRTDFSTAYDSSRRRIVLFGGRDEAQLPLDETWERSGEQWGQVQPAGARPGPRWGQAMAHDTDRRVTVMFGGRGFDRGLDDTWEWDGSNWTEKTPRGARPPAGEGHALGYDPISRRTLLATVSPPGVWEWDGVRWVEQHRGAPTPPPVLQPAMVTDTAAERIVMLGAPSREPFLAATWEWRGRVWEKRELSAPPDFGLPGNRPAMVHDRLANRTLMFCDRSFGENCPEGTTWSYDRDRWTMIASGGPALESAVMGHDLDRNQVLLIGPRATDLASRHTWVWDGVSRTWVERGGQLVGVRVLSAAYHEKYRRLVLVCIDQTLIWQGDGWTRSSAETPPEFLLGGTAAWDPSIESLVVFSQGELFRLDAFWSKLHAADARPSLRGSPGLAWDPASGSMILFGGTHAGRESGVALSDTWAWTTDPESRPGAVFSVNWVASGVSRDLLRSVDLQISAGGSGAPVDDSIYGAEVLFWDNQEGAWVKAIERPAPTYLPEVLSFRLEGEAARRAVSAKGEFHLLIQPRAARGTRGPIPYLALDYLELTADYLLIP